MAISDIWLWNSDCIVLVLDNGVRQFDKQGQKSVRSSKENIIKAKNHVADSNHSFSKVN